MKACHAATIALSLVALPAAASASAGSPRLVVREIEKTSTEAALNSVVTSSFALQNEGDAPLHVTRASADCACARVRWDREVAPHGSGKLDVEIQTGSTGRTFAVRIDLTTDDPANPSPVLRTEIVVKSRLVAQPPTFRILAVQSDDSTPSGITLWATDRDDLLLTSVEPTTSGVSVTFHEAVEAEKVAQGRGRQWRLEAVVAPSTSVGPIEGSVRVRSNHATDSPFDIPLSGFVRPLIAVTPTAAALGTVDAATYRRSLVVQNFGSKPLKITRAVSDDPDMRLEIEEAVPGKRFKIWVSFEAKRAPGKIAGTIHLLTDSSVEPRIEIAYDGEIR